MSSPPRVLHVVGSLAAQSGGVSRAVIDLAWHTAQLDDPQDITILTYGGGAIHAPWIGDPSPHIHILTARRPYFRFHPGAMAGPLETEIAQCDVVHLHGLWESQNLRAAHLARRRGKPYLCSIHGMLDPWSMRQRSFRKRLVLRLFEQRRLRNAHALHFTTQREWEKARSFLPALPPDHAVILPLFVEFAEATALLSRDAARAAFPDLPQDRPWIAFVSRIHPKKGLDVLIRAIALLPERHGDAQLVVAGSGDEPYVAAVKRLVAETGLGDRVHFLGLLSGDQKDRLYRAATCLAVPSLQENFGLVFPEALAQETPVVLTDDVDLSPEILRAGAGYLTDRSPQTLARVLTEILDDPGAAQARGRAGRQWVCATLQPEMLARRWRELYEHIAAAPASPRP